jgi:hypothetical protein
VIIKGRPDMKNKKEGIEVNPDDWVLMKGDEVLASNPDPNVIMDKYKEFKDQNVFITKNITGQHLFF